MLAANFAFVAVLVLERALQAAWLVLLLAWGTVRSTWYIVLAALCFPGPALRLRWTPAGWKEVGEPWLASPQALGFGLAALLSGGPRTRQARGTWRSRDPARQARAQMMRAALADLMTRAAEAPGPGEGALAGVEPVVFVATDIAGSTEAAQLGEVAFHAAQLEHDAILRRGLAKHGGLELATEGDAFFAAFVDVPSAVRFMLECQENLLEFPWPRAVLKLGPLKEKVDRGSGEVSCHFLRRTVVHAAGD